MPLVNVKVLEGALTETQKQELIANLTQAVVNVYGEGLRPHTWVLVEDVRSGEWGIGGNAITLDLVKQLMDTPAPA
ncbi:MAG: 4-oxalocrotonate tautomerase family protein [Chloroflexi bacterium]|nr:4-oxalocrotonate tautomerase family protein [Chloroflexota bacterium]